jgi:DNA excision repair protein ERCC-4
VPSATDRPSRGTREAEFGARIGKHATKVEYGVIEILADDRELSGDVVHILRDREGVSLRVERLVLGDYLIDDALLVERKTLPDLVASIKDGRLFAQGCRLAGSAFRAALILEGTGKDLVDCGMRREAVQGALIWLTLYLGIPLLRSRDPDETARLMLFAARQGRLLATGAPPPRPGPRPRAKSRIQSRVLQGLPGVGPQRAQRLLERFGSLEAVMHADVQELTSVSGIGQTTAEAIRWAVMEASPAYGDSDGDAEIYPI